MFTTLFQDVGDGAGTLAGLSAALLRLAGLLMVQVSLVFVRRRRCFLRVLSESAAPGCGRAKRGDRSGSPSAVCFPATALLPSHSSRIWSIAYRTLRQGRRSRVSSFCDCDDSKQTRQSCCEKTPQKCYRAFDAQEVRFAPGCLL